MISKRLFSILLLVSTSISLLQMNSCNKKPSTPENPFDIGLTTPSNKDNDLPDNPGKITDGNLPTRFFSESDYDASAVHGEKKMYHDQINTTVKNVYNDIIFDYDSPHSLVTYEKNTPRTRRYLCFDPTCKHLYVESCTSNLEYYGWDDEDPYTDTIWYPVQAVIDSYDYENLPVVYMSFRRHKYYFVNEVMLERESVYCIERFDMKTGKRTIVADNIEEIIEKIHTYGDYVYFTMVDADDNHSLCRIAKWGGAIEKLGEPKENTYTILDVVDDKLYYLTDERYLNRCELDLSKSELIFDLGDLQGNDPNAVSSYRGVYGGNMYYFSDTEVIYSDPTVHEGDLYISGSIGNLYRLPLNDLSASPEMIAQGVSVSDTLFTDDTLFYLPITYDYKNAESPIRSDELNNGTILALDLITLEETTVCENTGLWIFLKGAINCEDDCISFTARYGDGEWKSLANDTDNELIGKKSGGVELWYKHGSFEYENEQ